MTAALEIYVAHGHPRGRAVQSSKIGQVLQKDAHHGYALPIPYEVIQNHAPNYVRYLNGVRTLGVAYWKGANLRHPHLG